MRGLTKYTATEVVFFQTIEENFNEYLVKGALLTLRVSARDY